ASRILPSLYISDLHFAESPLQLASIGVTHVLSVLADRIAVPDKIPLSPTHGVAHITASARHVRVTKKQVRLDDTPFVELAEKLPEMVAFIENALCVPVMHPAGAIQPVVLVHCAQGISRSVSAVAAYLMKTFGWTPLSALSFIRARRPDANPNFGFVQQLWEYGRD
ncbi:phosphatases II, partial [Fistulina hepatica ATCC 64428]